jgi:hypothetical protein
MGAGGAKIPPAHRKNCAPGIRISQAQASQKITVPLTASVSPYWCASGNFINNRLFSLKNMKK